jgi:hypothetical protein
MTSAIKPKGSDLASRATGAALRESIEQSVRNAGLAKVDLSDVQTLAESFADEAFGVLALRHGVDWVVEHVEFHGASEAVLTTIARVIDRRCPVEVA